MKKILTFALLSLLLVLPVSVLAYSVQHGQIINIIEPVNGNLFVAGATVTIDNHVTGDVICAGQNININAPVDGDVICAGQNININAPINGSVRIAASSINVSNKIGHNLMAAGASILLNKQASVGWDTLTAAATTDLQGKVAGNFLGAGSSITIAGSIDKDVHLRLDNNQKNQPALLTITKAAIIGGSVNYASKDQAQVASGAKIAGAVTQLPITSYQPRVRPTAFEPFGILYSIITTIIVALVLAKIWPKKIANLTDLTTDTWSQLGWGLLWLVVTPIIAMIVAFTIIGIPLALIALVLWLIAIYTSKIIASVVVGKYIFEKLFNYKTYSIYTAIFFGIAISCLIFAIPFLGWLLYLLAIIWGMGRLVPAIFKAD